MSGVLRRVEAGERLGVTVSGPPVAELVPLPTRRTTISWSRLQSLLAEGRADAGLNAELRQLVPDTTDDLPAR